MFALKILISVFSLLVITIMVAYKVRQGKEEFSMLETVLVGVWAIYNVYVFAE